MKVSEVYTVDAYHMPKSYGHLLDTGVGSTMKLPTLKGYDVHTLTDSRSVEVDHYSIAGKFLGSEVYEYEGSSEDEY